MSGRFSRSKGYRGEISAVHVFQEAGIAASRVPLSGAMVGYPGDVTAPVLGVDKTFEVKTHATGFSRLYGWLASNYGLIVKQDRQPTLVVMRLTDFADLALAADRARLTKGEAA